MPYFVVWQQSEAPQVVYWDELKSVGLLDPLYTLERRLWSLWYRNRHGTRARAYTVIHFRVLPWDDLVAHATREEAEAALLQEAADRGPSEHAEIVEADSAFEACLKAGAVPHEMHAEILRQYPPETTGRV